MEVIILPFDKIRDITLVDSIFAKKTSVLVLIKSVEFLIAEVYMEL